MALVEGAVHCLKEWAEGKATRLVVVLDWWALNPRLQLKVDEDP